MKGTEDGVGNLTHKELLGEARITRILACVLDVVHAFHEILLGNAKRLAEICGVESPALLVHHHHNVVSGLVVDKQPALAIYDSATRRELYLLEKGVGVSALTVVVAHDLQRKQPQEIYYNNACGNATKHITPLFKVEILHTVC